MKTFFRIHTTAAVAALLLAPSTVRAQLPRDPVERAKVIARRFEAGARQLTLFDREGKEVSRVGARDMYSQPVLSPDGKRVAVVKADLDKEGNDLWVLDVATGKGIALTAYQTREFAFSPAWSPDGHQVAYAALREGYYTLYRKAANGEGPEESLYRSGAPIGITDWSVDGRFLSFISVELSGSTLYVLPLDPAGDRKPIEIFRSQSQLRGAHLSPDQHFVAYVLSESGKSEVYVRPFDPAAGQGAASSATPWQISDQGGQGLACWRRDGKELYYLAADRGIMAVSVTTSPHVEFGKPRLLFRPAEELAVSAAVTSLSPDGDRIVIAVPPPQLRQLTVFDREGHVLSTVGQPGLYFQPAFSPDGARAVALGSDSKTGRVVIWAFDLATGEGKTVTNDPLGENTPIWSPDGKHVAYVSTRKEYSGIYRRASDGTGDEELLFRYTPGAGIALNDWSPDGQFLSFSSGGVLLLVPLRADERPLDRKALEWLREEYDAGQGQFSPDGRFLAFLSNEADPDKMQVCVRPFDPSKPEAPGPGAVVQVSTKGAIGMISWRQDGRELYYMTRDWEVMAVDVTTTPTFHAGEPRLLFKPQGARPGSPGAWKNVSRDGQRFIFALPVAASAAR